MSASRSSRVSRSATIAPVAAPAPAAHIVFTASQHDGIRDAADELSSALYRYQSAIYGFADLLLFAGTENELGGPTRSGVEGWASLARILADEAERISKAADALEQSIVRPRREASEAADAARNAGGAR